MAEHSTFEYFAHECVKRLTICGVCHRRPDRFAGFEDPASYNYILHFYCHGDRDVLEFPIDTWFSQMRRTQIENLVEMWPKLVFDRYTMIPLPASLGFTEENDDICATGAAGLDWLNAHQMDPHQA